ncbi:MAG TPA: hypothetical protein VMX36_04650 [Sedimentisphaerales bacterium]|nr:hypothetical protein [Sedimentisphaerales bacterium]
MATVQVEMSPVEFAIENIQNGNGTFSVDDVVTFTGHKASLRGRVTGITQRLYGLNRQPGVALKVAITAGRLSDFSRPCFAGYTVTKTSDNTTGTVRTRCQVKFLAQLMSRTELQNMLDTAQELIKRAATLKMSDYALQWFGREAFESQVLATIHRRCAELHTRADGLVNMIFQCMQGETLGGIDDNDPLRNGGTCRIRLGRGFTYDRYSWGERVCTIVHELTHWFLDTVDQKLSDGTDCYGANCIRLAKSDQKSERLKALNNADNWAYYICQYRSAVDGRDWRYFTEEEIRSRGPFVPNGYNVVPALRAFYP